MKTLIETPYGRKTPELLCAAMDAYVVLPDLILQLETAVRRAELANLDGNKILSAWLPDAIEALERAKKVKVLP